MNAETARVQAALNRGDTITPFGNITNRALGNDRWETRVDLSPEQLAILRQGEQLDLRTGQLALDAIPRAQRILSSDIDVSGLQPWLMMGDRTGGLQFDVPNRSGEVARGVDTARFGQADIERQRVEQALLSRLEPQFARDREALEGRLLAQGFQPGTAAYQRAADELNRAATDARFRAVLAGGQEQSRLFGLGLQDATFRNQATGQAADMDLQNAAFRNQAVGQAANLDQARTSQANALRQAQLAEQLQLRAQPINEISALFGLGPGMQMPQAANLAQVGVAPPDFQGAVANNYQQQVAAVNARNQASAGLLGSVFGLGGSALGGWLRSDRRLKRNVARIGTADNGLPIYRWTFVDGAPGVGFMADEVARVRPEAVAFGPDGYAMVNYALAAA